MEKTYLEILFFTKKYSKENDHFDDMLSQVPITTMIPLRIATRLSMLESEKI